MQTEIDYHAIQREAAARYKAGDLNAGIDLQLSLADQLMGLDPKEFERQPKLGELLEEVTEQVIGMLNWQRRYDQSIRLQERLADLFPESAEAYRLSAAQLRIEAGYAEVGLDQLQQIVEQDPENYWSQLSLATSYLWLGRDAEAEAVLRHSGAMTHIRKVDRALAYQYLFQMYGRQEEHVSDALAAWREAYRLDSSLRAEMLPAVCRMLIYWRSYAEAKAHIAMIRNRIRRLFYQGLLDFESGNPPAANESWRKILEGYNPTEFKEAVDEYAETCIRLLGMSTAVKVLQPLVDNGDLNYLRLVILGLAWAQKRDLAKASWYLSMALRLGDGERVRLTRPAPQGLILDSYARMLYAEVTIDPDVRQELDSFFMPTEIAQV